MRLGEYQRHEELHPAAVVRQPVVRVHLVRALVAGFLLVEVRRQRPRQCRADRDHPGHPVRVPRGQLQGMTAAERHSDGDHPVNSDRVEDGHRVVDIIPVPVGAELRGPTGSPVAPPLDGDHPEVPGQVRDLCLPLPGVHDRPRGEQQDHHLARAEYLVADLDAAAFHETFGVRIHRPHDRPYQQKPVEPISRFYRSPLQCHCNAGATPRRRVDPGDTSHCETPKEGHQHHERR
jgi:hypothetical protein